MAGQTKTPDFIFRPARRLIGALAKGVVITASSAVFEVVVVAGSARGIVRAKVSGAATLDFHWLAPDTQFQLGGQTGPSSIQTEYTSGNPTQVVLGANTEGNIQFTHNGEGYGVIRITDTSGSGNTISYVDYGCI